MMLSRMAYSMTSVTVPAPTVWPPSRMAKRSPFSMAMGAMSSIVICVLSHGITISTPSGKLASPFRPPTPPGDREDLRDGHQDRLVDLALGKRHVLAPRLHQLQDRLARRVFRLPRPLQRLAGRAPHHRHVVPGELVGLQELPDL